MRLFDTHAHLSDARFDEDRDALIRALPERGVARVIDVGCDLRDVSPTLALAERYPYVYAAVGMHPHEAEHMTNQMLLALPGLLAKEKVVALGEIGLDYHYDLSPREVQRKWFGQQLELACSLNVPVSLHIREAFGDCMDILRAFRGRFRGVMHCWSGSLESAYECLDMGLYLAFGGSVTFKNASRILEVAARVPLERLLVETDCPYLAPEPFRGRRNDPTLTIHVIRRLAQLRQENEETLAEAAYQNGLRCFDLEDDISSLA